MLIKITITYSIKSKVPESFSLVKDFNSVGIMIKSDVKKSDDKKS